jgi:hypothetical protein
VGGAPALIASQAPAAGVHEFRQPWFKILPPCPLREMSDRHIRAMLRGATAAKLLDGWQGPHLAERTYCIAPRHAAAMERPLDYVIGYCELLAAAGVEPLYRESEPLF